jgi:catechol 2,3-dioxygenase-like lactoylglutathione lyase family enzyme
MAPERGKERARVMAQAKFRHIAISTDDPEKLAAWYVDVFGLTEVGTNGRGGVYLSDGEMNFAVLRIPSREDPSRPLIGFSHYGFMVEDPIATYRKLERAGVERLPDRALANQFFEARFVAPDGIVFEISEGGWPGTAPVPPPAQKPARAKFRHVAIMTEDPHSMAEFYNEVFGLVDVGRTGHGGVYMSDGDVNMAILFARKREGMDKPRADVSHFGFMAADTDATVRKLQEVHAKQLPAVAIANQFFEMKFEAPDGVSFDISEHGWPGTTPVLAES